MRLLKMSREEWREIGGMFGPLFIEQLSIALIPTLVSMMVKGTGLAAVAAVNLLNTLVLVIQQVYTAIGVGVSVVVAQYRGRGDVHATGRAAAQCTTLAIVLSCVVAAGCYIAMEPILSAVFGASEEAVYTYRRIYLAYNLLSLPFIGAYTVAAAAIRGSGYPRLSLVSTLINNISYAVIAIVAVNVFNGGLVGVCYALVISRFLAGASGMWIMRRGTPTMQMKRAFLFKMDRDVMKPLMQVSLPVFLENLLFQSGKLITQTFSIAYGTVGTAVNGIATNMFNLVLVPGSMVSNATTPIVGRMLGAGDVEGGKRKANQMLVISLIIGALFGFLMLLFMGPLARFFSDDPVVQAEIKRTVAVIFVGIPLSWPFGFVIAAGLRASGDSRFASIVAVICMAVMRVGLGYYLTKVKMIGVVGIWIGCVMEYWMRGVFLLPRLLKGKWAELKLLD
ncbi:MAG: MATE family efflux transporter [Clostridia bacterium]|nr:MATE family efflux transporter [Clostridia bacterium]